MAQDLRGRRGAVFSIRVTDEERATLAELQAHTQGPSALGAWIKWRALAGSTAAGDRAGSTPPARYYRSGQTPARAGTTPSMDPPIHARIILDLCGGTGSWSQPYRDAGYRVEVVTLPDHDVRTYVPPPGVWGILAAPPCTEFSMARNGHAASARPPDFLAGMETVNACLRVVLQARPRWWALENPSGHLSKFLGTPRDVFEPHDFGDPWTKTTSLWGEFVIPERGPFVKPLGGGPFCLVCDPEQQRRSWCSNAAHRAVTPPGFARAFAHANP